MRLRPYQKLLVWQQAHALSTYIYDLTESFPDTEKYGLISQLRRAATSVPSNIVEGSNKKSLKERNHYYEIATCSLEEVHYQCFLAKEIGYISDKDSVEISKKIESIGFLLSKLRQALWR